MNPVTHSCQGTLNVTYCVPGLSSFCRWLKNVASRPCHMELVWDWASSMSEFLELLKRLETTFGTAFIHEEWSQTFNAVFNTFAEDGNNDGQLMVITSSISHLVQVVEATMALLGIVFNPAPISNQHTNTPPIPSISGSCCHCHARNLSNCPSRCCNTCSIFVDLSAVERDEDSKEDDEVSAALLPTWEVQPAGQGLYSRWLDQILKWYKGSNQSWSPPHKNSLSGQSGVLFQGVRRWIYVVEFLTNK